jgi:hypothetical protein
MSASYGISAFGTGAFGIAAALGVFEIEDVFAVSDQAVRFTTTYPCADLAETKAGSVFNPGSYTITNLITGEQQVVLGVAMVEGSSMRQFDIALLQKMPAYPGKVRVLFGDILDDTLRVLGGARTFDIEGCATLAKKFSRRQDPSDIRSVPNSNNEIGGILRFTAGGDLDVESGTALLKKIIIRRLTTAQGEFAHLRNRLFGLGLQPKEVLRITDLVELRNAVEREVLSEPDVASAVVSVSQSTQDGVLSITISATRRVTGETMNFDIKSDSVV